MRDTTRLATLLINLLASASAFAVTPQECPPPSAIHQVPVLQALAPPDAKDEVTDFQGAVYLGEPYWWLVTVGTFQNTQAGHDEAMALLRKVPESMLPAPVYIGVDGGLDIAFCVYYYTKPGEQKRFVWLRTWKGKPPPNLLSKKETTHRKSHA